MKSWSQYRFPEISDVYLVKCDSLHLFASALIDLMNYFSSLYLKLACGGGNALKICNLRLWNSDCDKWSILSSADDGWLVELLPLIILLTMLIILPSSVEQLCNVQPHPEWRGEGNMWRKKPPATSAIFLKTGTDNQSRYFYLLHVNPKTEAECNLNSVISKLQSGVEEIM